MTRLSFIGGWTAVVVIGETSALILATGSSVVTFTAVGLAVLLGALVLGAGQSRLLRLRGEFAQGWLAATILGTGAGRFVEFATTANAVSYLGAVELGCLVGACMAVPQAFVLRHRLERVDWWVCTRAAAWALAVPLLMAGASAIARWPDAAPLPIVGASIALFAAVVTLVGIAEGVVMDRLLTAPQRETSAPARFELIEESVVVGHEPELSGRR
jgi:hypothetical protein